jgi:D-alanine-D-alanine ligase
MRVGVLMGGVSDEREVSLSSGVEVAAALREAGHDVVAVDTVRGVLTMEEEHALMDGGVGVDPPTAHELQSLDPGSAVALTRSPDLGDVDVFFLALHGGSGEDGTIQGLLDAADVSYTGSDRLGCSLAMDKEVSKRLLREAGIPTPDWLIGPAPVDDIERVLGLPVIVKAAAGGSSLRLILAHDQEELQAAIDESLEWDDVVLFERYVHGRELTVGVVGGAPLPIGEIIPTNEIFDYECKYQPGMAEEIFPANVPDELAQRLRRLAVRAHVALRLRDYSRIDFILDDSGVPWCLEANAAPGMTRNSLLPKAGRAGDISFAELCDRIVRLAQTRQGAHST